MEQIIIQNILEYISICLMIYMIIIMNRIYMNIYDMRMMMERGLYSRYNQLNRDIKLMKSKSFEISDMNMMLRRRSENMEIEMNKIKRDKMSVNGSMGSSINGSIDSSPIGSPLRSIKDGFI